MLTHGSQEVVEEVAMHTGVSGKQVSPRLSTRTTVWDGIDDDDDDLYPGGFQLFFFQHIMIAATAFLIESMLHFI